MSDVYMLALIAGFLAVGYLVREFDPNLRTSEQAEREAMAAKCEQMARDEALTRIDA